MTTVEARSPVVVIETPLVIPRATPEPGTGSSNKKAPQKRKKPTTSSPSATPTTVAINRDAQSSPAEVKTNPSVNAIAEEVNGERAVSVPPVPVPLAGTASTEGEQAPAAKKQKKKHTPEGAEPAGDGNGKTKPKKLAKQVRFQIKLYPPKQPAATPTPTVSVTKKKKAKQQQQTAANSSKTTGPPPPSSEADPSAAPPAPTIPVSTTKKPTKRNRSKGGAKVAPAGTKNGTEPESNRFTLPPSTSFTPLKRVLHVKQEPKTAVAAGRQNDAMASGSGSSSGTKRAPHGPLITAELDSVTIGRQTFAWLIGSITVEEFMMAYWERKPLLVKRSDPAYYAGLLSRAMIDEMLRTNNIEYTKNIDITSYTDGQRETHNPEGRVLPPDMWHFYGEGCSVRMLNPQTYLRSIYELNVKLQEYFHCMTGANFYLTPPNSQGFAPHYDDIEAFVLQIEGRKRWRLYPPRRPQEVLARVSSDNLAQDELAAPLLDVVLEAGDLLYFPRGCIHQAATVSGTHSLHVTLSVYQRNSWVDLFEQMFPLALSAAAEEDQQLRGGLPLDLHHHFGIVHSDELSFDRRRLIVRIRAMFDRLFSDAAIDAAVDQLAKRFQHDALPPMVDYTEWDDTVYGGGNHEFRPDGTVRCVRPIEEHSSVRLLRRNILRLVSEEDKLRIYYHTDNSREYHQYEANFLELDHETALGVELLIKTYPCYVLVSSLPVDGRLEFIRSLWEKGLIVCRRPVANDTDAERKTAEAQDVTPAALPVPSSKSP
ncbi:bifunctional lysine-specific demethylase and histidyl-hydroxylase NO66 [Anopheles bellator]|uniref:bifunctional lysine-specific demethylase and histidyl-hydroxylase NO66 n=1 Tax=Anopheles bellator TaxID=139047 RepID=UPI002648F1F2|nr:bifunctional lysine-specific demethylase and histidyl-hydroxylase NO66 [Anopheles bellator]